MRTLLALGWFLFIGVRHYGPPLISECESGKVDLTVTLHATADDVTAALQAKYGDDTEACAWTDYYGPRKPVHLHLPRMRGQDDEFYLFAWGHELAHEVCGPWHPNE